MPCNPLFITTFNDAQMSRVNNVAPLEALAATGPVWVGELSPDEGEYMAGAVLIGPFTGDAPVDEKVWDSLTLNGDGRAMTILWIDKRQVATGMLNLGGGPRQPNKLNIPERVHNGYSLLALVIFTGEMLGAEAMYEPMVSGG